MRGALSRAKRWHGGQREQQGERQGQEFGFHPWGNKKKRKGLLPGKGLNLWLKVVYLEANRMFVRLCAPSCSYCTPAHHGQLLPIGWILTCVPVLQGKGAATD